MENMNYENEQWVSAKGFDGLYEVSDMGRIKSYRKQPGRYNTGTGIRTEGKLLKPQRNPQGYLIVKLYNMDGTFKQFSLHKLIWESFMGNVPELNPNGEFLDVHHRNSNREDCRLQNLALVPHSLNVKYSSIGKVHSKPVVRIDDKGNIVARYDRMQDARSDGFERSSIRLAIRDKRKYKGFYWALENNTEN